MCLASAANFMINPDKINLCVSVAKIVICYLVPPPDENRGAHRGGAKTGGGKQEKERKKEKT